MTNQTITRYERDIVPTVEVLRNFSISGESDMETAAEKLTELNRMADRIAEEKEKVTRPLNEALKAERSRWKPLEAKIEEGISIIRGEMGRYQTEENRRVKAEEAAIAARVGQGKGKLRIETAVSRIENIEKPIEKVAARNGQVTFRTVEELVIWDETLVPREFLAVDEARVKAALKAGMAVPGAGLEERSVPVNARK